jgi:DnaD/phage-associated family protein|nr:MAG TPA: Replication initiation and membrane attachment [Caudoviricetes sp.]
MAELKYIPFYPGYMEDTSDLSDGEFRRLMYALCAYCEGAERPEPLTGKEVIAYRFITRNIKVSQEQYNAKCRKNSENAKKRTIANDSERKRSQANDSKTSQYKEQRTKNKEQNIITTTTTTAHAPESLQQCVECYEQNIGALPRAAFDSIVGYLEQVEPDLVCEAINQAAINNKRSWGYAQAILRDCLQKNITTRAAYLAEKEARSQQKGAAQRQQMKTTQEKLWEIAKGGMADDLSADGSASVANYELLG